MTVPFSRWPDDLEKKYRKLGCWEDKPLTDILRNSVELHSEATAIVCGERSFTYGELDGFSDNLAKTLSKKGLKPYDTALVQLPNIAEFYIVFFALLKIGVVPVNALFSHQRLELLGYARQIYPSLLIADKSHSLFSDGNFTDELKTTAKSLTSVLVLGEVSFADSLSQAMGRNNIEAAFEPTPAGEVAFFQLSGGSTGTPKLIPRTHNDYLYSVRRSTEICQINPHTRYLCALPAPHNFTLSSPGALGIFDCGGTVILAPDPEPFNCFFLINKHAVNMVSLVPPAVSVWLKALPGHQDKLKTLSLMQVGGASFSEKIARRVPEEFQCQLQQVFGMAEGLVNYTRLEDEDALIFCTQGRPMSSEDEIKVVDEDDCPVSQGQAGNLLTRGPYTIRGYYNCDEYNLIAFDKEGFYRTGDVVRVDDLGYLHVVGREKDQINRGGEKIASEEIEKLLLQHPSIIQAALVSMPDSLFGEKSCAFLVVDDPRLRSVILRKYLRELGLAQYKFPDRFEFIERLPLTPVGKIDKKLLRVKLQIKNQVLES